jgi:hypothetical protein
MPPSLEALHISRCNAEILDHLHELAINREQFLNLKLVKIEMQIPQLRAFTKTNRNWSKQTSYQAQNYGGAKISKEKGLELLAQIRTLFGATVDLQVLLLDARITGDGNPVWSGDSNEARNHFYFGSMPTNLEDVDFDGFC